MREILHKLNKTECLLINFSVFHGLSQLFLGTFVISFLMHNSVNEIISVSIYNLFFYFAIMLTFVLMINCCKHRNINTVFGSHLVVQMILVALIAILGKNAVNWVIILGMLYGTQQALYSMSVQQMIIDKVNANRMLFFYGSNTAITNITKIIIPVILGALITISSLQNIAWVILAMGLIEFMLLFMMPQTHIYDKHRADLMGFIMRSVQIPCVRKLFHAEFLRGLAYVLEILGTMYIVHVFHTDMNLGAWTTVFALCTAMAAWLFGRFCSNRSFKWVIALSSILLISAIISLIIDVNRFSVLAYAGTLALAIELMDQIYAVNVLNLAKTKFIPKRYRAEYLAARQTISFIGRWGGILLLLYVGVFAGYSVLPHLIIVLACARILSAILYVQLSNYATDK